jgi:MFS family permease
VRVDSDQLHATASRKAAFHLLPILCLVYFMAFVDRTNVGLAKTALGADVGISVAAFGAGAGIFFLSYALLEVPSNLIMYRVGPRRWITRIALTWGTICACMMFVQGETSFYILRFLLGAAEAGLYPALMYVVTLCSPRSSGSAWSASCTWPSAPASGSAPHWVAPSWSCTAPAGCTAGSGCSSSRA